MLGNAAPNRLAKTGKNAALIIGSATLNGLPDRAKRPKYSTNKALDKSGVYSNSPKVADPVIEAKNALCILILGSNIGV